MWSGQFLVGKTREGCLGEEAGSDDNDNNIIIKHLLSPDCVPKLCPALHIAKAGEGILGAGNSVRGNAVSASRGGVRGIETAAMVSSSRWGAGRGGVAEEAG